MASLTGFFRSAGTPTRPDDRCPTATSALRVKRPGSSSRIDTAYFRNKVKPAGPVRRSCLELAPGG